MHSQISIEYIAIVGLILFLTIPLLYYSTQRSNEDIRSSEIDTAINSIKSTADKVFSLGLGTKDYTWVKLPTGVQSFQVGLGDIDNTGDNVEPNEILFKISIFGGLTDISKTTIAPKICKKTGTTLPTSSGNYKIVIEYVNKVSGPGGDGLCNIEISCGAGQC